MILVLGLSAISVIGFIAACWLIYLDSQDPGARIRREEKRRRD